MKRLAFLFALAIHVFFLKGQVRFALNVMCSDTRPSNYTSEVNLFENPELNVQVQSQMKRNANLGLGISALFKHSVIDFMLCKEFSELKSTVRVTYGDELTESNIKANSSFYRIGLNYVGDVLKIEKRKNTKLSMLIGLFYALDYFKYLKNRTIYLSSYGFEKREFETEDVLITQEFRFSINAFRVQCLGICLQSELIHGYPIRLMIRYHPRQPNVFVMTRVTEARGGYYVGNSITSSHFSIGLVIPVYSFALPKSKSPPSAN